MAKFLTTPPAPAEITLDDLVQRVEAAAWKMGKKNPHRILLLNTAAALKSVGLRLEEALEKIEALESRHLERDPGPYAPLIQRGPDWRT